MLFIVFEKILNMEWKVVEGKGGLGFFGENS